MADQLHKAQISILSTLRHKEAARFTLLMRPTGLESDTFKFHIRKLVSLGYVEKTDEGHYQLTAAGKEFANNLDEAARAPQRQPKLSVLVICQNPNTTTEPLFLFQQRKRNPFFDFWSCIGGPVQWGDDFEETAAAELHKQTGLTADCAVRGFYRQRDYTAAADALLEDKLFVIVEATRVRGELSNAWYGGVNTWMSAGAFQRQPHHFASVLQAIDMIKTGQTFASHKTRYSVEEY